MSRKLLTSRHWGGKCKNWTTSQNGNYSHFRNTKQQLTSMFVNIINIAAIPFGQSSNEKFRINSKHRKCTQENNIHWWGLRLARTSCPAHPKPPPGSPDPFSVQQAYSSRLPPAWFSSNQLQGGAIVMLMLLLQSYQGIFVPVQHLRDPLNEISYTFLRGAIVMLWLWLLFPPAWHKHTSAWRCISELSLKYACQHSQKCPVASSVVASRPWNMATPKVGYLLSSTWVVHKYSTTCGIITDFWTNVLGSQKWNYTFNHSLARIVYSHLSKSSRLAPPGSDPRALQFCYQSITLAQRLPNIDTHVLFDWPNCVQPKLQPNAVHQPRYSNENHCHKTAIQYNSHKKP